MLRDHGQAQKYYHDVEGYNGRLDALQARILRLKLSHLSTWNDDRRHRAETYRGLLSTVDGLVLPFEPSWSCAVYHLYVVQVQGRRKLQNDLKAMGIGTGIHYPIPLHLQKAYHSLGYETGDFPVSERIAPAILSLPMYPQLTRTEQESVAQAIKECLSAGPKISPSAVRQETLA
jgi:dTDP-4-amino-4,6-dideoxygalactose transaminase